jgi:hypothetical protein
MTEFNQMGGGDIALNGHKSRENGVQSDSCGGPSSSAGGRATPGDAPVPPIVGNKPPTDTTGDGLLNDIDGDGVFLYPDVVTFFNLYDTRPVQDNSEKFNFGGENPDRASIVDVVALFRMLDEKGDPNPDKNPLAYLSIDSFSAEARTPEQGALTLTITADDINWQDGFIVAPVKVRVGDTLDFQFAQKVPTGETNTFEYAVDVTLASGQKRTVSVDVGSKTVGTATINMGKAKEIQEPSRLLSAAVGAGSYVGLSTFAGRE